MAVRFALVGFALLVAAGPASAQLDAEPKTPYLWRVVVKTQPHPLLSPAFREQLRRDLAAALQPALGTLGSVEVVDLADLPRDRWDTLWEQFEDKGFPALDASRDLTGAKSHFLRIEYRDGQYHLEARQHDGFTGLASPVVRRQSVRAPELVGRTAGLMLDRDFGLSGTVELIPGAKEEAKVVVRAGQLGSAERFVKAGDVFAVSQVSKTNRPAPPPIRTATGKIIAPPPGSVPPPGLSAKTREFTLLRVVEVGKDGTLRCGVLTRYQNAFPIGGSVVGYRCTKLGTVEAPLAVRVATSDPAYQKSVALLNIKANENGFATPADARDVLVYRPADGVFQAGRTYSNVACITVALGPTQQKQFPVPVLGPEPVVLPFEINPKLEAEAEHMRGVLSASARIADARNAQTICFEATAKFIEKSKNAAALERAKGGFEAAKAVGDTLADDLVRLKDQPDKHPEAPRLLANVEQQLLALREFNKQLEKHVKTLEEVVKRENDPTIAAREVQAQALNTRITLLLGRGDIDEAIVAYNQLLTIIPDDATKKAERDRLIAEWKPKSEAHAKARDYLLKTWPAVATIPDFRDNMAQITASVDECIKSGDRYALRKILTIFDAARVKLNDLVSPLDANAEADKKLLEDAKKAGEALAALEIKITEFVNPKKDLPPG